MSTAEPSIGSSVLAERRQLAPSLVPFVRLLRVPRAVVCLVIVLVFVIGAVFAPLLAPYDPLAQDTNSSLQGPSNVYLLGTDLLGRDELSRMMYGARVSLGIGLGAVSLGAIVGVSLGLVAGFTRGLTDEVIMRLMEVLLSFPGLILALGLVAALGPSVATLVVAIGIGGITGLSRLVRSRVLSVREHDFVLAARTIGARNLRTTLVHVWSNSLAPVIVALSLGMGGAVLAEAGLSFLGVGVPPPTPSWGSMLQYSFGYLSIAPFLSFVPGVAIFLLVLSFNLIGGALRDALDPSLRHGR
ncbi:MAG: ABC transporter permease [Dehalococcoidia bacterium]